MKNAQYYSNNDGTTYNIKIGENAQDNWDIISDSYDNDLWFHVRDAPSCHVVLCVDDISKKIHRSVIKYCALQCKMRSKSNKKRKTEIIYTTIGNVTKTKKIGEVVPKNTKQIKI